MLRILLMFFVVCAGKAFAADDCGLSTININSQDSILSVQGCIKTYLTELRRTLNNHEILVDKFDKKARAVIAEEGLCAKLEEYYKSADASEKRFFYPNVKDCYALLGQRAESLDALKNKYDQMSSEADTIKKIIRALEAKYSLLSGQLEFLKSK